MHAFVTISIPRDFASFKELSLHVDLEDIVAAQNDGELFRALANVEFSEIEDLDAIVNGIRAIGEAFLLHDPFPVIPQDLFLPDDGSRSDMEWIPEDLMEEGELA